MASSSHATHAPPASGRPHLPATRLVESSRIAKRIGRILLYLLCGGIVLVAVAPWQQTVIGKGGVIAFAPLERQQTIEAPMKGRIVRWGEAIFENAHIKKGQLIAEIQDQDPNYLERLKELQAQAQNKVAAAKRELESIERQFQSAEDVVNSYERQVVEMMAARDLTVAAADEFVNSAHAKYQSEEEKVIDAEAVLAQDEADFVRQSKLFEEKIASEQKLQVARQKYESSQAKVAAARKNVEAAKAEYAGKLKERDAKEREAQVKVDQIRAYEDKARQDAEKVIADQEKAQKGLAESMNELTEKTIKVAQQETQTVVAPRDGFILRLSANEGSEMVKEGDPLCVIVPDTADRAVQLWVKGIDAPLVSPGDHVRLQFEGWPAVQFAGWPSVAVGTFGANVVSVDATDNGKGEFRVLAQADPNEGPWPDQRYLRQGVQANGFILLKQVPLWYEIWRKMNGFPPTITSPEKEEKDTDPASQMKKKK